MSDLSRTPETSQEARPLPLTFRGRVSRHHPGMPRLVVVPAPLVEGAWGLTDTTVVEGTLGSVALGRRTLKRWDEARWWFDLPAPLCERAGVDEGDEVDVTLSLASTALPAELAELLDADPQARAAWDALTSPQRRMVREEVYAARAPETRRRRAARLIGRG